MADNQQKTAEKQVEEVAADAAAAQDTAPTSVEPEAALTQPVTDEGTGSDDTSGEEEGEGLLAKAADAAGAVADKVEDAAEAVVDAAEDAIEAAREVLTPAEQAQAEANELAQDGEKKSFLERAIERGSDLIEDAVETIQEIVSGDDIVRVEDKAATTASDLKSGRTKVGGYKGEIIGEVVKLEDLENQEDEVEEQRRREALRKLIEPTITDVPEQDIVTGRVVTVGAKDVLIDFGFKSDGTVPKNEFDEDLQPGDTVEVFLERKENYKGEPIISKTKAVSVQRWRRIEKAFENEEVIEGTIIRRIKGGMIAELDLGKMEAFLPGSQIDVRPVRDFDAYLERRMEFKVVKLNPSNENIVISHKALVEKDLLAQRETILQTMEPGQILEGVVKNITDFGVFVDLGGVDGLLHITDLSWGRVSHPSEVLSIEDKINVVVLDYDRERQRISLGYKQLMPHPWETIHEDFTEGQVVEGKVVSITDYGAFVELDKGIEGLVHISEMSWTEHVKHPSQVVNLGQITQVKILNIDDEQKKISLGMKQMQPDPWDGIAARHPVGSILSGKVRNITAFGVFVEIEEGIDGLVHISDLSWTKKVRHPGEVVRKGQEMQVQVLGIDERNRRISLGHKQVETNPWKQFENVYAEGTQHQVTITRVIDAGLTVELPLEVEGFIPAGELARPADSYREGQTLDTVSVIRFDGQNKDIILSEVAEEREAARTARYAEQRERREGRQRERRDIENYNRSQTGSGPATLGELSGLEALKAQFEAAEAADADDTADKAEGGGGKPVTATSSKANVNEIDQMAKAGRGSVNTDDDFDDDDEDEDDYEN
jgi:small subunit ribosomal protein S1